MLSHLDLGRASRPSNLPSCHLKTGDRIWVFTSSPGRASPQPTPSWFKQMAMYDAGKQCRGHIICDKPKARGGQWSDCPCSLLPASSASSEYLKNPAGCRASLGDHERPSVCGQHFGVLSTSISCNRDEQQLCLMCQICLMCSPFCSRKDEAFEGARHHQPKPKIRQWM